MLLPAFRTWTAPGSPLPTVTSTVLPNAGALVSTTVYLPSPPSSSASSVFEIVTRASGRGPSFSVSVPSATSSVPDGSTSFSTTVSSLSPVSSASAATLKVTEPSEGVRVWVVPSTVSEASSSR